MAEFISIIVPVYNEEESLPHLYKALKEAMKKVKNPYEFVFVDDGSRDESLKVLEGIQKKDSKVVVVSFRRNFGQTPAMAAGFQYAKGDVYITMDADLQNDPADIPLLIEKNKGCGYRKWLEEAPEG